ncbi:Tex family protein [Arthrobacter sp. HLT1-21]
MIYVLSLTSDAVIFDLLANELGVHAWQVKATVDLLDAGSTVPFVARYRKEATGSLDDAQLRSLDERLGYLRELQDRRRAVLESIEAQGKLTDLLRAAIAAADTKSRLEDIYLPFKTKRRTKAQIARESGLESLADALIANPSLDPTTEAGRYVTGVVPDAEGALAGARSILVERAGQNADLLTSARERLWKQGLVRSKVRAGKETEGQKFADYFQFAQAPSAMPSHRVLALFRGEKEGMLELSIAEADPTDAAEFARARTKYESSVAAVLGITSTGRPADAWLTQTVQQGWRRILAKLSLDLRVRLFAAAETEAVRVFAANLRDVLLAAPAGGRTTLGLDPGLRTGVKVAVVDGTGKAVATQTVYPHAPVKKWDAALAALAKLVADYDVELIAIGNGTASRETDKLSTELIKALPERKLQKLVVSEAGASVYSASALASAELPDLDVSLRGAVSIARRLQDPLAELVKIDPKSIGVGQYQHDVTAANLERSLNAVIEDCVNAVGVDVNTASPSLLSRVAGVGPLLSENIVAHRNTHGRFARRADLLKVSRLGAKAFEQCAGFLRVSGGTEPLDASSVHPEAYGVARRILSADGTSLRELDLTAFVNDTFGLPTIKDIVAELEKPGRDPRPEFVTASFSEGVEKISDLVPGMTLDGVVTNVAAFGAFVDVGVHQDGLVHISAMSNRFVSDPHEVVKSGQVVKVKVLEVDPERKRISLTLRLDDELPSSPAGRADTARPDRARGGKPATGKLTAGKPTAGEPATGKPLSGKHMGEGPAKGQPAAGKHAGRTPAPPANSAMTEALRKAGLA